MSWTTSKQSTHSLIYAFAVISLAAVGLWIGVHNNTVEANTKMASSNIAPAASFNADAASLGAIADSTGCNPTPGTPRNVTFTTSGLSGNVATVQLSMTLGTPTHTWMGDVIATLIAPNGASHTIFGVVTSTTATGIGDSSDLGGTYVFTDTAAAPPSGGWWQESIVQGATGLMTSGTYRTTASGGAGQTSPAPPTSMNPSFTGVSNANGTWTLRFTDGCTGDTGNVSAANLTLTTSAPQAFDANTDFNGDGKTDFVVARATTTPLTELTAPSLGTITKMDRDPEVKGRRKTSPTTNNALTPPIYWYSSLNGSGTTGVGQLGDAATDFVLTEDFDGDGKDDLTVWTEDVATSANFKILQSSNNTVRVELFGQTGDDPAVVGDYDGDGKADPAVYRCPGVAAPAGQCFFFYRGSLSNPSGNVTYVPWGFGNDGDFFPYVGDFDGDGKNDFCVQRTNPSVAGQGQFVLLKSNGLGIEYINWGNDTDFLIPGDYDGDLKTDFCVRRTVGTTRTHYILTRTGATSQVNWGLGGVNGDTSVPGDYDGDGKTDLAVWRGSATPGASTFWILNSSNSSVTQFVWGSCPVGNCDYPVANWAVH
jgi:subtilisin-like proprotein convertase family protein